MWIETERLVLRPPVPADVPGLAPIWAEEETMRFVGGVVDEECTRSRLEQARERWERDGFGLVIAERREDRRIVGELGIFTWETVTWDLTEDPSLPHEVELGWLLGRDYQGRGYATEAARALREWALRELAPPRLVSLINVENEPSQRLARRLGCTPERRVETAKYGISELWLHP